MNMQDFGEYENDGIVVSAQSILVDKKSDNRFCWGYYLCIENNTESKIQLVGKEWKITDEAGNCYIDNSAGFKGELPELEPGEYFEFTSSAPLSLGNAVFYGSCKVLKEGQKAPVDIKIPTFNLSAENKTKPRIIN